MSRPSTGSLGRRHRRRWRRAVCRAWTATRGSGPAGFRWSRHMQNPHCPAVHMNTRMFWTPHAWWFGGGEDLNPCIEYAEDTAHFHDTLKAWIAPHGADLYPRLKEWADEYFFVPHRGGRGAWGVFMDDRNTGDWAADFALTQTSGGPSCRPMCRWSNGGAGSRGRMPTRTPTDPPRALCRV